MPILKMPLHSLRQVPALAFALISGAAVLVTVFATHVSADGGVVAICGSTCVGEERNGDPLCHWAPATPGQTCKAKGICSPSECTVWWTAGAPAADAFQITPAQAKQLPGARTTKGPRPPSR